jgi:hypothetical protein
MKITLAEIKSLEASLSKLFDKEVNIKVAYRLSSLLKRLSEEMTTLEENRVTLIKKYGEEDAKTKQLTVTPAKTQDFYKEFSELMQLEIEIDFKPIPLSAFGDIALSASDVLKLDDKIIVNDCVPEVTKDTKKEEKKKDKKAVVI